MRALAILTAVAACSGGKAAAPPDTTAKARVVVASPACREAYAEYETRWRAARTEELHEFVAGDNDVLEEILFSELGALPSRTEVGDLQEIYALLDVFLWDAPWPRALAAAGTAIERCGDKAARPEAS